MLTKEEIDRAGSDNIHEKLKVIFSLSLIDAFLAK
jgi:hypothetical protein